MPVKKGLWFEETSRRGEFRSRDGRFRAEQRSKGTKGWVFWIYDDERDGSFVGKAAKMPGVVSLCKGYLRDLKQKEAEPVAV